MCFFMSMLSDKVKFEIHINNDELRNHMRTYEGNKNMEKEGGKGGGAITSCKIHSIHVFKIITTITHVKLFKIFSTIVSVLK